MQVSIGEFTAVYGSGILSVFHPAFSLPAQYAARPFDYVEPESDQAFDCESQLRDAIAYTARKFFECAS